MSVTSEKIKLYNVRLSFPVLTSPRAFAPGQQPKYQATFLLDPTDTSHAKMIKEIKSEANRIAKEHFKGKVPHGIKLCFGMAEDHPTKSQYAGYEDMFYIATSSTDAPVLADEQKRELDAADNKFYAGCYVNTIPTLWVQDNQYGKRINANLRIVQFVRDGEAFSSYSPASIADELDVVETADTEDEWDDAGDEL